MAVPLMRALAILATVICLITPLVALTGEVWAADAPDWYLVDGVVATIDGVPVLRSDIHMAEDLGLLEANGGSDGAPNGSGVSFEDLRDVYLNRMLILREVEELGGYRLNSGEAEGAYSGYVGQYPDKVTFREKLHMWGIDEVEVFRRLKNALLTTLYTESRLQFLVNVLPSDIEGAYREDPERWGNRGLYESWEAIRGDLIRETFAIEKRRWLETLRERYELVLLDRPDQQGLSEDVDQPGEQAP
jgi:hypothetical protein